MWLCYRTACIVWKVKLIPAVQHVMLMELKKTVLKFKRPLIQGVKHGSWQLAVEQ